MSRPTRREERRAAWEASGAPAVQERLRIALAGVGVDLRAYSALVRVGNNGEFGATVLLFGPDLDAVIEALERGTPA